MKLLLLSLSLLISLPAFAQTTVLTGTGAKMMMESLAGAGFEVKNLDGEWQSLKNPITIETGAFFCRYHSGQYPDGWMVDASCQKGINYGTRGAELSNPLALSQAIRPYAAGDGALGTFYFAITDIKCSLLYKTDAYRCEVTAIQQ